MHPHDKSSNNNSDRNNSDTTSNKTSSSSNSWSSGNSDRNRNISKTNVVARMEIELVVVIIVAMYHAATVYEDCTRCGPLLGLRVFQVSLGDGSQ